MATQLGITAKYLGMIERGEKLVDDETSLGLLFRIAEDGHKVEPVSVMVRDDEKPYRAGSRMIPVIGWAHAGEAESYEELPKDWQHRIPTECPDDRAFAVSLEGDSMEPKFSDGDMLVVQPSEEPYSGCFVVARFANDGIIFRRMEMNGERIRLMPLNERWQPSEHERDEFTWIYPVWGRWTQIWRRR